MLVKQFAKVSPFARAGVAAARLTVMAVTAVIGAITHLQKVRHSFTLREKISRIGVQQLTAVELPLGSQGLVLDHPCVVGQ
ncbi:MAG: hypothetical protein VKO39_01460 [Cyanobacteriota bacterium]|nr:hypothetical protein [Cyanobacteriota bacterium]